MKAETFIKLINDGEYYALYQIPDKGVKLIKVGLDYNERTIHSYFDREIVYGVCTNIYECEDSLVAVSGVTYISKDTYALPRDIGFKCVAMLFKFAKENDMQKDDIKRWLPKGTEVTEVKFGDNKAFKEAFIPEGHRRDEEPEGRPIVEPVHPDYYKGDNKDGKSIEVFDIIDQFVSGDFYLGNVLKYVCRAGKKSKETKKRDLEKALHYITEAMKRC